MGGMEGTGAYGSRGGAEKGCTREFILLVLGFLRGAAMRAVSVVTSPPAGGVHW